MMWRTLVFLLPLASLLLALAFAAQTQNVQWRFQAPVYLVLLYALLHVTGRVIDSDGVRASTYLMVGLVAASVAPSIRGGLSEVRMHRSGEWRTYLEDFAGSFGPLMGRDSVVALTEAGALPYWTRAQIADIVGLNHPAAALTPPTAETLRMLDPDMVFLHQGTSLTNDLLIAADSEEAVIYTISPERLGAALRPSRREILERGVTAYDETGLLNVQYAPSVMIQYLSQSPDYDIFVIDPNRARSFVHVIGLRKTWPLRDEALQALRRSLAPENYGSYLEIRRGQRELGRPLRQ